MSSYEDYRRALEMSDVKLEFCDGDIYAMAGGTPQHAALGGRAIALLTNALGKQCTVYSSDLMIRVETSDLSTYPDGSVICGELQTATIDKNAAINPVILVEVTSKSTEDYDRGDKLSHYKQLPSLRAVLLISHRTRTVTVIERDPSGWSTRDFRGGETVTLTSPDITLAVDALYEGIALDA
jgi:Uma2 family endonuclease